MEESQPYSITFEEREQYLYAFVTGEQSTLDISMKVWNDIAEKCRAVACDKLLVEEDFPNALQTFEMYRLGEYVAELKLAGVKLAFVDRRTDQQDVNDFGMTVAKNRGIYGMTFSDAQTAQKWLLKS